MIEQINGMDRVFLKLSGRSGAVNEAAFVAIRTLAKRTPNLFVKQTVRKMSDQSRNAILRDPAEFVEATVAALINPGGALDDYRTWNQPWGFDVADIAGPVKVWQGAEDELCPPQWGQRLADAIPASQLYSIPGAGHFIARDHWADIFDSIERS
jgi:pimeloyl-ACP methyl ester carboxylesterase